MDAVVSVPVQRREEQISRRQIFLPLPCQPGYSSLLLLPFSYMLTASVNVVFFGNPLLVLLARLSACLFFIEPTFSGSYGDADYLWSPVFPASLGMPCARSRHSVCVWAGEVFVYGGRGTRGTLKDFWRYEIGERLTCLNTLR